MSIQNSTSIHHLIKKHSQKKSQFHAPSKEAEPFSNNNKEVTIHEVVEHEIKDPQLKPHIQARKDVPTIPPDLKKLGITTNSTSSFSTLQSVKLPLAQEKIPSALNAPLTESIRWLGELTRYLLEQSHGTVKTAHKNIVQNFLRMLGKDFGK